MRRYDLDSLRVIVFLLLILYHVGMFFVPWDFHLKNDKIYDGLIYPMLFVNQWRLSILFVISGMGTYYSLQSRSGKTFASERLKRLFIPLLFGILVIVPPQIYFEWLDQGKFCGNYFQFWFSKELFIPYPNGGAFSWHHLWFILYLLIFSLLLIPLFLYLRKHPQTWIIRKLQVISTNALGLYIFLIPLFLWQLTLAPYYPPTNSLIGDWFNLVNYCTLFFFGYLLISLKDAFWNNVLKYRLTYLLCGIIAFPILLYIWFGTDGFWRKQYVSAFIKVFNLWSWILVLFGFAARYLNKPGKILSYANESVYPLYILHQTVIIILGYYIKHINIGFFPKFSIMVIGTFGISLFIYEFGIRRYALIRPLFGLKKKH